MNQRLQTKCFIASAATHALLVLIVFVAPAFLPEKPRPAAPVMRMIDARLLDRLESRPLPAAAAPLLLPCLPLCRPNPSSRRPQRKSRHPSPSRPLRRRPLLNRLPNQPNRPSASR